MDEQLAPLRALVKEQGDKVRAMKAAGAPDIDVKREVNDLKARRKNLEDMTLKLSPGADFDRTKMADLAKRRFFYDQSFSIYGGISGQYDFGSQGTKLIKNILKEWDAHFILKERMLEVSCSILTPEAVLKASGHVDKFADYMVKDKTTGECYRLDHLIKLHLEKKLSDKKTTADERKLIETTLTRLDGMTVEELGALLKQYSMTAPSTGNELTEPSEFNLMFPISIGPSGNVKGFLRPETAQGIFVNFKRLLEDNHGRLPFAVAQVGNAYRNEISPRSGLLRVREFTMAEIEHFCDPDDKSHPRFHQVAGVELMLYSACAQMSGDSAKKTAIGQAVHGGTVANETLAYYMARIQQFLVKIGVDAKRLRFRQHMSNEMAHYAQDCWDAEILTSYGWVECVGCADRSAFDLKCHSNATGVKLSVERPLAVPREAETTVAVLDKGLIGKTFKKEAKDVTEALNRLSVEDTQQMDVTLAKGEQFQLPGCSHSVTRQMVPSVKTEKRKVHVEEIIPSVIEPSFGIGRVFYALLEHTFTVRADDDKRTYFALPALVAPIKAAILPLSSKPEFVPYTNNIDAALTEQQVTVRIDDSTGSIGRRYARTDEVSIPYCVTIDFDTLTEETVTLRERDSTQQVRLPVAAVADTVAQLTCGRLQWADVTSKYPLFVQQENTAK